MDVLANSLAGLGSFFLYFLMSLAFLMLFKFVYVRITPHDEWKLVKEDKNIAAAIALAGSIIGYSIAIASAASNSVNLIDFAVWGIVALLAQLIAFVIVRFGFMPKIVERIEAGEIPAGILMAATSVSVGLLNAACMTY
jgi:putative membrane protein